MIEFRARYPVLQVSIAREDEKPLAVTVQPSGGIHARHVDIIRKCLPLRAFSPLVGELGEHVERLVEEESPGQSIRSSRHRRIGDNDRRL